MLILPIQDARPGMKLAMTVADPAHPEKELLTAGYPLDEQLLNRLRDLGITVLYVAYPDLADLDRHLAPYLTPVRREIYGHIRDTISLMQAEARLTVNFGQYYTATRELITSLFRQGRHPVYLEEMLSGLGADGVRHAAAVAHLAMVMGIRLESYIVKQRKLPPDHAREITNLGVAGMLHDIGKMRIPGRLQQHTALDEPKNLDDARLWQAHPSWSYEMIRNGVEASAAAAVLHHHQHFDGSGFPQLTIRRGSLQERVEGLKIHIFGRILVAADLYERLTLTPAGRRRSTLQILHLMRTTYAGRVDPQILRVLPSIIPPYPPGATLKLSDGTLAAVLEFHPREPYYPTIRRLDTQRWTLSGAPFNVLPGAGPSILSVCGTSIADAPPAAFYADVDSALREIEGEAAAV
ncbi:MAG TPA: HD domain-containing phosphohydrolase [Tepidisphaeraceae bacterium]|nr:HD domain-containing phosphohydrolase [Tepidisphaeraceae bacterium]